MTERDTDSDLFTHLKHLLSNNVSRSEIEKVILLSNVKKERAQDPEFADLIFGCAISPYFDADVIGALRGKIDETEANEIYLERLAGFSFVSLRKKGQGYVYHDSTRQLLLDEIVNEIGKEAVEDYKSRLLKFFEVRGTNSYETGAYKVALEFFNAHVSLNGTNSIGHFWRGKTLLVLGDTETALDELNQAISIHADRAEYYFWRGRAYQYLDMHDKAISDYSTAIDLDPQNFYNYQSRGFSFLALHEYSSALQDLNMCISFEPTHSSNYLLRGLVYKGQDQLNDALEDFTRTIELRGSESQGVYVERAAVQIALEHLTQAIRDLNWAQNNNVRIDKKVIVRLVKSPIGYSQRQKDNVRALGLRKLHSTAIHKASPSILGMIRKVQHLVTVEEFKD